jgi:hypothetical protein
MSQDMKRPSKFIQECHFRFGTHQSDQSGIRLICLVAVESTILKKYLRNFKISFKIWSVEILCIHFVFLGISESRLYVGMAAAALSKNLSV